MGNYRTSRYDAAFTDHTIVHHDGTHTDEHIILDGTTVHNRIMTYTYIIANGRWVLLVSAMDSGVVRTTPLSIALTRSTQRPLAIM